MYFNVFPAYLLRFKTMYFHAENEKWPALLLLQCCKNVIKNITEDEY